MSRYAGKSSFFFAMCDIQKSQAALSISSSRFNLKPWQECTSVLRTDKTAPSKSMAAVYHKLHVQIPIVRKMT